MIPTQFARRSLVLLALASLSCSCLSAQVRVQISDGTLEGSVDNGTVTFKGIPYAKPPVGDLRWTSPVPPDPWTGVRKATEFSAGCIQDVVDELLPWTKEFMVHGVTSEDCLYLNLWTPSDFKGKRMPVYAYIHGGGFPTSVNATFPPTVRIRRLSIHAGSLKPGNGFWATIFATSTILQTRS